MLSRRFRATLALILCVLLVGMQREFGVHALTHAAAVALADQPAWHVASESCTECALLAAGAGAITGETAHPPIGAVDTEVPLAGAIAPALSPPSFYRSRAPPSRS